MEPENYESPVTKTNAAKEFRLDGKLSKLVDIYLEELELKTDDGWYLHADHNETVARINNVNVDIGTDLVNNYMFDFEIWKSTSKRTIKRSYIKIQDVIA